MSGVFREARAALVEEIKQLGLGNRKGGIFCPKEEGRHWDRFGHMELWPPKYGTKQGLGLCFQPLVLKLKQKKKWKAVSIKKGGQGSIQISPTTNGGISSIGLLLCLLMR